MKLRPTIVRGTRIAITDNNRRSYKPIRGLMRYIALGRLSEQQTVQRGQWFDHNGKNYSQKMVEQWAKEKVHRFGYGKLWWC